MSAVISLIERLLEGQKELHEDIQNLKKRKNREKSQITDSQAPQQERDRRPKIINDSRYGALDQRLNESRRTWKTPRKSSGDARVVPGYDWVAGLLDTTGQSVSQFSTTWLQELKEFRQVNHSECYMPQEHLSRHAEPNDINDSDISDEDSHPNKTNNDYIHSYSLGDRLFPVPINCTCNNETRCPVCEDLIHPNTSTKSPSLVQVSVPHDLLQVQYKSRPHRRVSFNPSDSLGLSQHCLSGWHNSRLLSIPHSKSVSLKSSIKQ
ncbi:PREDICTED: migration and invasion-inhibitory protein-like isoform X1 [Amphimedon queenslandica]|uniref:Migration and invasion-inhibitory protein n=1 Tax=Amphimedon queenslandica TaxID=400682 RepID=A0A1X7VNL5_AMPQE|nr:PREDICTED: migration and invasion-inhibitory protein-like isoform X1 [Amphimedon queenslandica]|eukprot:XP_019862335.1 PREDICTED: migration and invasion-inhibitory protein-like isoform X1 [Amphimedon queenslandica]